MNDWNPMARAYPFQEIPGSQANPEYGLSKRELFAAMAMQGALGGAPGTHLSPLNLARESVAHADALLLELSK